MLHEFAALGAEEGDGEADGRGDKCEDADLQYRSIVKQIASRSTPSVNAHVEFDEHGAVQSTEDADECEREELKGMPAAV
ncbi:hypothetical protein LTS01_026069, partial [Friedmanniomyces endolithicus]